MAKVYVKINELNIVVQVNSDIFLSNVEGYILIDEGEGYHYAHAQNNYLPKSLMDEKGIYNYKYVDNELIELSEAEKELLFPPQAPSITDSERLELLENAMQEMIIAQLGG